MSSAPLRIVCAILAAATQLSGQVAVRNGFSTTSASYTGAFDANVSTAWTSQRAGDSASVLLEDHLNVEADFVLAGDSEHARAYQLLGSSNYRDWAILSEGNASTATDPSGINRYPGLDVRYLRMVARDGGDTSWEVLAGSASTVEECLGHLGPVDWGNIKDPQVIAGMLDLAFTWQQAHLTSADEGIGWIAGAYYTGVSALYRLTGDSAYAQAILSVGNRVGWTLRERTSGKTYYHADDHCIGQSWLELYMDHPDPQPVWYADVEDRLERVMNNPIQGRIDMNWCDALYMSPPNYGMMAGLTGDDSLRTFIDTQWWDVTDFLYDTGHHLFYRDSSYFGDVEPNGKPVFWSRGNGWVVGGLVRMLEYMPADWPTRPAYEQLLSEMCEALAAIQGADGLWSSSLLYPEKYDMERETSGSAFFVYAMAWGINNGILDSAVFGLVVEKAWEGLSGMLNADGSIDFIQQVGAGPALNNGLYSNKDYGYGAFLLAGTEMIRYFAFVPLAETPDAMDRWRPVEAVVPNGPGDWSPVADFEGAFGWQVVKSVSGSEALVEDPFDPGGSRVFSIDTGNRSEGEYRATTAIPAIGEGDTGTVYQRFCYNDPEIDVVFGVSGQTVVDSYGDYETGLRIYFGVNQLEARAGSNYIALDKDLLQLGTWYEAWTVIDNAADTYDVYLRGGSNYPVQRLLRSGIPFRNGTSASLRTFAVSYNSRFCEGAFLLDDIQVDSTGLNLSRPGNVRQSFYSPWSETGRDRNSGHKQTGIGIIWDGHFPWTYLASPRSWARAVDDSINGGGTTLYLESLQTWVWLPQQAGGWAYRFSDREWFFPDAD